MSRPLLVVLSGAGISAESGLKTFRDSEDGLWNGYDIEEVATPQAFQRNPQLVLDFYNWRRQEVLQAKPNEAHMLLASLEKYIDVCIITQNIDDLHERAGSTQVLHLHGEILKQCSAKNKEYTWPCTHNIQLGDSAPDGGQMRPFIVWFGEEVPMMEAAAAMVSRADIFAVIGTSLQVYPAAGLTRLVPSHCLSFVIDRSIPYSGITHHFETIEMPATLGVAEMILDLKRRNLLPHTQ